MNSKHMMPLACAAAICGSVPAGATEESLVSAEVTVAFDSKFMSYGLVDNNDPILTPAAALTFYDWVTFSVESIFDISHYGKDAGYGDRAWTYQEIDPGVALSHAFGSEDAEWLPTTVEFELGYMYEAHPKSVDEDTQFLGFAIGFPDFWVEPVFAYELDIERDHGTYLNLEFGHTFTLVGPSEEEGDDILDFRMSVAQGWGDARRIEAYLEADRSGMMDFCLKGELTWKVADGVAVGAYVAYTDYLFDSSLRNRARDYEATGSWDESWNYAAGCSLSVSF